MARKEKFATRVDSELLAQTRAIAETDGRQIQSVVVEALRDLVEKKNRSAPRAHVMNHYQASVARFGARYERLAK